MLRSTQLKRLLAHLGEFERRKGWINFQCPFHGGSRYNFGVNISTRVFKCLGCTEQGSLEELHARLSSDFDDAGGVLTGPDLSEWTEAAPEDARGGFEAAPATVADKHDEFMDGFEPLVPLSKGRASISAQKACQYLRDRGVPSGTKFAGVHEDLPGRVVFPFFNNRRVVYYVARDFMNNQKLPYINANPSDGWPRKGDVLWNSDEFRLYANRQSTILTEGLFDALAVREAGYSHSTCILGKTIAEGQVAQLKSANIRDVTIMLDRDAEAEAAELGFILYNRGFHVRVCLWDGVQLELGKDPGQIGRAGVDQLLRNAVNLTSFGEAFALHARFQPLHGTR